MSQPNVPHPVTQTSKSAVSQVSKPARVTLFGKRSNLPRLAGLEASDTAGLETCDTSA